MNLPAQIFVILAVVIFLIYIIAKLIQERLEFKYALIWIGSGIIMLVLAAFPGILARIAELLSIGLPLNLVFFLGILLNLVITFALTITYSKFKNMLYRSVQNIAILEYEIDRLKNRSSDGRS